MPRIIEVIVSPSGETRIKTSGYTGADCMEGSKFLEQALGVTSTETRTAEFYESATISEQNVNQD